MTNRKQHSSLLTISSGILLVISFHLIAMALGYSPDFNGNNWYINWDTDSYSRILRVIRLYETGAWYDPIAPYYNAPFGVEMHWSRALDIILYAGAWFGSFFTDFNQALEIWAMLLLGPIVHLLLVVVLYWLTRSHINLFDFSFLILLLLSLNVVSTTLLAGFIDYHGLLILFVLIQISIMIKALPNVKESNHLFSNLGVLSGVAVWLTIESLILLIPALLVFIYFWIWQQKHWLKQISNFSYTFVISLLIFLMLERPANQWLTVEYDRLSILQIFIATMLLFAAVISQKIEPQRWLTHFWQRGSYAFIFTLLCISVLICFFPNITAHPQQNIGEIAEFLLDTQPAEQPYLNSANNILMELGPLLLTLPYIGIILFKGKKEQKQRFIIYLIFIAFFFAYLLLKGRAIVFLQISLLLPWLETIQAYRNKLKQTYSSNKRLCQIVQLIFIVLIFAHYTPYLLNKKQQNNNKPQTNLTCDYEKLIPFIEKENNSNKIKNNRNKTILAPMFDGPKIAYLTSYSVITSPYHRNQQGIDDGFVLAWSSPENPEIKKLAQVRTLEYVLICRQHFHARKYLLKQNPQALFARLYDNNPPNWLKKTALPGALEKQFILYKYKKSNSND